jgi:hypothetical protein
VTTPPSYERGGDFHQLLWRNRLVCAFVESGRDNRLSLNAAGEAGECDSGGLIVLQPANLPGKVESVMIWHRDVSQPDGGPGHIVKLGRLRILRQGAAVVGLDCRKSQRAIRTVTRQHHADRMIGAIFGQGAKEGIDRHVPEFASAYLEHAMLYRKIGIGQDDVDMVGLDRRSVGTSLTAICVLRERIWLSMLS